MPQSSSSITKLRHKAYSCSNLCITRISPHVWLGMRTFFYDPFPKQHDQESMQGGYVDGAVGIAAASTGKGTTAGIGTRVGKGTGVREGAGTGVVEGAGAGVCAGECAATVSVGAMVDGSVDTSSGAGARSNIPVSTSRAVQLVSSNGWCQVMLHKYTTIPLPASNILNESRPSF